VPLWDIHRFKDGTSFYFASRNTIAYYLDPRNFFVDVPSAYMDNLKNLGSIFMFSSNAYFENQDGNVTNKILAGTFLSRERTSTVTLKIKQVQRSLQTRLYRLDNGCIDNSERVRILSRRA
jgi:hypothetical protein